MKDSGTTYSPENPRPWDPNHPLLKSGGAPHETNGVMRVHRAGFSGKFIMKVFKMGARSVSKSLEKAMEEEQIAARQRRDIHCPPYDPQKT
ncbi:hypothetical protein PBI_KEZIACHARLES14_69 [Mycobacterium phage Keziacharles14]|nr:hypothetical protein PBI_KEZIACHARLES14_69 [Mycobacterium phage Keziacharles14]